MLCYKASLEWLAAAESRLENLSTVSDNVRAVRIQLEQIKVTDHIIIVLVVLIIAQNIFLIDASRHNFWHKIGYSLNYIRDIVENLAPYRGSSASGSLTVTAKFALE